METLRAGPSCLPSFLTNLKVSVQNHDHSLRTPFSPTSSCTDSSDAPVEYTLVSTSGEVERLNYTRVETHYQPIAPKIEYHTDTGSCHDGEFSCSGNVSVAISESDCSIDKPLNLVKRESSVTQTTEESSSDFDSSQESVTSVSLPLCLPPECETKATSLKTHLKEAIMRRRQLEGKELIRVEFKTPEPVELTSDEMARREVRREQNRLAAKKCRQRKQADVVKLETELSKLHRRRQVYQELLAALYREKTELKTLLQKHSSCPQNQCSMEHKTNDIIEFTKRYEYISKLQDYANEVRNKDTLLPPAFLFAVNSADLAAVSAK